MPRATAADAAKTAQDVLDRAAELFAARGFAGVSLDDVGEAAGVTRGAVYHHYASKAGLFAAVVAMLQERVAQAVVAAADSSGADPASRLRAGSHAFLDAVTAAPAVRILLVDAPAVIGWEQWRRVDAEHSGAHLRDALRAVGVEDELLDAMAAQLSGAMNEAALQISQHRHPRQERERAGVVLDLLLAAATRSA